MFIQHLPRTGARAPEDPRPFNLGRIQHGRRYSSSIMQRGIQALGAKQAAHMLLRVMPAATQITPLLSSLIPNSSLLLRSSQSVRDPLQGRVVG
jgi:hypothetical protein